jgi:hypothetical protein
MKPGKCSKAFPTCWSAHGGDEAEKKRSRRICCGGAVRLSLFCVLPKWHHQKQQQQQQH